MNRERIETAVKQANKTLGVDDCTEAAQVLVEEGLVIDCTDGMEGSFDVDLTVLASFSEDVRDFVAGMLATAIDNKQH